MNSTTRRSKILDIARTEGLVAVEMLASRFAVAPQTVRRDLATLCDNGQLERVHGGAVPAAGLSNHDYVRRQRTNADGKTRIGKMCARAIPDNVTVFMNSGTTAEAVAREMLGHIGLVVVTNSLNTAHIMSANPDIEIIVAGGTLRRADGGLLGTLTTQIVDNFKFDYTVMSCDGIDSDGELLAFDLREVIATQTIVRRSRATLVVADQSKMERTAPGRIGSLADVETLFTDKALPSRLYDDWTKMDVDIRIA